MDNKREKRLKSICEAINQGNFGGANNDAVMYLGGGIDKTIKRFPTGHPDLDYVTGGGYPIGRFIEIYGPEGGGKSTTCLHAIAEHQKMFPEQEIALIDTEYTFDPEYATTIGVNIDTLILCQPESGEQALNVLRQMIQLEVKLIIVDSVAALVPEAELEGNLGDAHVAKQARLLSQTLRVIVGEAGSRLATVIFTNQLREKIGVTWGDKNTTPGGRALGFYSSIRMDIKRIGTETQGSGTNAEKVGAKTRITIKKNKTAPPFKVADLVITFGLGFDVVAGVFDAAVDAGIFTKKGKSGHYYYDGETLANGRINCIDIIRADTELLEKITGLLQNPEKEPEKAKTKEKPKADPKPSKPEPPSLEFKKEADTSGIKKPKGDGAGGDGITRVPVTGADKPTVSVSDV